MNKWLLLDVDGVLLPEGLDIEKVASQEALEVVQQLLETNEFKPVWCTSRGFPKDQWFEIFAPELGSRDWDIIDFGNWNNAGWWKTDDVANWLQTQTNLPQQIWIIDDDCPPSEQKALSDKFGAEVVVICPNRLIGLRKSDVL